MILDLGCILPLADSENIGSAWADGLQKATMANAKYEEEKEKKKQTNKNNYLFNRRGFTETKSGQLGEASCRQTILNHYKS